MPDVFLGLDFGLRRIGIAVGQTLTRTASPLGRINARDGEPDWPALDAIIKEWQPSGLVVGLPLNMDNTEQFLTECAKTFKNALQQRYALPVHMIDERLSTLEAKSRLYQAGKHRALHHKGIDSVAAQIILEAWLTEN